MAYQLCSVRGNLNSITLTPNVTLIQAIAFQFFRRANNVIGVFKKDTLTTHSHSTMLLSTGHIRFPKSATSKFK